jgi:hypothetical protein
MKQELLELYEDVKTLTPAKIKEEIVFEGCFYTVARVTVDVGTNGGKPLLIVAEGESKRSGDKVPDEPNRALGRQIAMGRARNAVAKKLSSGKLWCKIGNPLEA